MKHILEAGLLTLRDKKLLTLFLALWGALFFAMFFVPIEAIPGNDVQFQAMFFGWSDYVLLAALSFMASLVLAIQAHIFRDGLMRSAGVGNAALGGIGVVSGFFSSMFALSTCALCAGTLFGFLGFGSVYFLVEHRWYVVAVATALLLISLYSASRRLVEGCRTCALVPHEKGDPKIN